MCWSTSSVRRYVLVNEFRADLSCASPKSAGMVPDLPGKEYAERIRDVAEGLRRRFPEVYLGLADAVEQDLGLAGAGVEAPHLGAIDTFRFEEERLLAHAAALIAGKGYKAALGSLTRAGAASGSTATCDVRRSGVPVG